MNSATILIALIVLCLIFFLLWRRSVKLLKETKIAKYSQSSKYGKMTEQFMPFLAHYPYDPHNFRFLGTPIDGVQFLEDEIIFLEFKTSNSKLTAKQKNIRGIIDKKNIRFEEIRI